jgi:3,4-dihydroxy 2-butanone 4-phosphate synthase/GTP cyclohydrolase II
MPTAYGEFELIPFIQKSNGFEHIALIKGTWTAEDTVLVRVHSSCITGDIFGSMRCDCGEQLHSALQMIEKEGRGVLVYLNQEGRGIGLFNKMKAYKLQELGRDTVEANIDLGFEADERDYGIGANILRELGLGKIKLITNNPKKRIGLQGYGLTIVENVHVEPKTNKHNKFYLETKQNKMGHFLNLAHYKKL